MDINIRAMAYSPVSPNLENSNQWQEAVGEEETEELGVFKRYIQEIVLKNDINDVTRGTFVNPDTAPQEWLDNICEGDYELDEDSFKTAAKNLSEELNSIIHTNSKDGVLFCVQATVSGEEVVDDEEYEIVSLLKLDLIEEERLKLGDNNELTELDLSDIFPEPKELQKGLIYPIVPSTGYRLPGDVKFYQSGTVSNYFHDFLECETVDGSLEQAKSVFEVIGELKEEHTGETTDGDDVNRFKQIRSESDSGLVGIDEVTEVASDIVGREISESELASRLDVDNPTTLAIDTEEMPSIVKYEVDHEIEVKFPSSAEERVEKEEGEEGVEVRISGGDLKTRIVDR